MGFRKYTLLLFTVCTLQVSAQIGGESTFRFLDLTNSARMAALGGFQVALGDSTDLNLPFNNPALLHREMSKWMLVNYVNYLADINYGYASYAHTLGRFGNVAAGMHYINYGDFTEAGEEGEITGKTFKAAEYALNLIWANHYRQWRYGVNLKPVLTVFETYQSLGLVADAGIAWQSKNRLTTVGVAARNFGSQLTTYYPTGEKEPVPFDLQAGISQKLAHAPIALSLTTHHLNHWDLANADPEKNGEDIFDLEYNESIGKQLLRHLVWGIEVLPSPSFTLRAGYNYQLRQELKLEERASTVGFSLGFGVKVKRFKLDYAITRFHLAGSSNLFSLSINLNKNF